MVNEMWEQRGNKDVRAKREAQIMLRQVTEILVRSRDTLLYDLGGVAALAGLTLLLLHLPGRI